MNRKVIIVSLLLVGIVAIVFGTRAIMRMNTKKHSPVDKASITTDDLSIIIIYCRPYKKDRLIFGDANQGALQPYGNYWRLGANEATTIETSRDIQFGSKKLPKGRYSMYAFPDRSEWTIGVNAEADRWGYAEPNHKNDLLQVKVPVHYLDDPVEQFLIKFNTSNQEINLQFTWDTSQVSIPIH